MEQTDGRFRRRPFCGDSDQLLAVVKVDHHLGQGQVGDA